MQEVNRCVLGLELILKSNPCTVQLTAESLTNGPHCWVLQPLLYGKQMKLLTNKPSYFPPLHSLICLSFSVS